MGFYDLSFISLIAGCGFLTWRQYHQPEPDSAQSALLNDGPNPRSKAEATKFTRLFLVVYMLVMGADWLQGPYVYALYKHEFGFSERVVAALFTTGFLSGAISGYFVGSLADRYGRRTACQVFCITYSLSCFSTLFPTPAALFVGRCLGGFSTSIMYSAFESWMVTEFHKRQLDKAGNSLSSMFGIMTTMNSVVAILAGVVSEWLVEVVKTKKAPFMASAALLTIAFWVISTCWVLKNSSILMQPELTFSSLRITAPMPAARSRKHPQVPPHQVSTMF
jgi:MFS family permease